MEQLKRVYEGLTATETPLAGGSWKAFEDIISPFEDPSRLIERLSTYGERLGVTNAESKSGHFFVNGKYFSLNDV